MAATARKLVASPDARVSAPVGAPGIGADQALLEPTVLLASGGDGRITLDEASGANRYGCGATPDAGMAPFGSSTASTISLSAHAAVQRLTERLAEQTLSEGRPAVYREALNRIRHKLTGLLGLADMRGLKTILSPSGTDLHRIALYMTATGASAPPLVILPEPYETGSGVIDALGGRLGPSAALRAAMASGSFAEAVLQPEIMTAPSRRNDGVLRPAHQIDEDIAVIVSTAARMGRRVLLVLMDVSKTGLISPSVGCAQDLKQRFPDQVDVLVDACQLRLAPATLAGYLRQDFMVAVTGSKFITGPAFSAALLVPPTAALRLQGAVLPAALAETCVRGEIPDDWLGAPSLPERSNFGLLVRWEAALEEMQRFAALSPAAVAGFFADFGASVAERLWDEDAFETVMVRPLERTGLGVHPSWDREQTIFPFLLRANGRLMSPVETLGVQRLLGLDLKDWAGWSKAGRRAQLGQPVNCGMRNATPLSALRLCLSARLAVDALAPGGHGVNAVIADAMDVLDKTAWLTTRIADQ